MFHTRGVKHGQDHLDIGLLMNGDHGFQMIKLQGTFKIVLTQAIEILELERI